MTIQLPKTAHHLIHKVSEEKLVLIALLHKLRKEYGAEWYSLYRFDITTIISSGIRFNDPHKIFTGLTEVVRVRFCSDIKLDLKLKRWTSQEFDYKLNDFKNVIVWTHILDQGNLEETDENRAAACWTKRSGKDFENLSRLLKIYYLEYERNRIRE